MAYTPSPDDEICGEAYDHDEVIEYDGPDGVQRACRNCEVEGWEPRDPEPADRAAEK